MHTQTIIDVDETTFETAVVERSRQVPVVVDFWADWCGPCRTLGPLLEAAVQAREGRVVLAKVDVDANPAIAQRFRVQGIPQVYGFRDGEPIAQFTGVVGQAQLDAFFDQLVPSASDDAVAAAADLPPDEAERVLRDVLADEPGHRAAAVALAKLLVDQDPQAALELVTPHRPDPSAESVAIRAELAADGHGDVESLRAAVARDDADTALRLELARALAAREEHDEAIDHLLTVVQAGGDDREAARAQIVSLFAMLGDDDPRVAAARPRLARALF